MPLKNDKFTGAQAKAKPRAVAAPKKIQACIHFTPELNQRIDTAMVSERAKRGAMVRKSDIVVEAVEAYLKKLGY